MSWWGKVLGGAFGFMAGGPLGALLGAALGHQLDRGMETMNISLLGGTSEGQERIQTAFFTATFSIMGHIAKADGRVSREEIAFAEAVMRQMELNPEQRKLAINLFNEGKLDGFDLDAVVEQFRQECNRRRTLMQMFLEIQLQAALSDGVLDAAEKQLLQRIFTQLGFSQAMFERLVSMVTAAEHFSSRGGEQRVPPQTATTLNQAYQLLGVDRSAPDADVKRAYRRLMNQHHPDKLVAKGLPEEMVRMANEKVQEIRTAYDQIKASRGMGK
jgi:DnaJ like chaperone protein